MPDKPEQAKRRITNLTVDFISLVELPANGEKVILKGQGDARTFELVKADDELQRVYGIVYAVGKIDTDGDFVDDPAVIRKAANDFMARERNNQVDSEHSYTPERGAFVAESWLVKDGDSMFGHLVGAWAVAIQVDNVDLWKQFKEGSLAGLSLAGYGRGEEIEADADETEHSIWQKCKTWIREEKDNSREQDMTDTDKQAIEKMIGDALAKQQQEPSNTPEQEVLTKEAIASMVAAEIAKHNEQQADAKKEQLNKGASDQGATLTEKQVTQMIANALQKGESMAGDSDTDASIGIV